MPTTKTLCYNCFRQVADPSAPCPHCGFDLEENQQKFPVALRAGTVLNDRYIVGRVLGQGGFGITYVAFDTQLQARVAIKEYMPSEMATRVEGTTVSIMMDTRAEDFTYGAERFQEEARTLAKFIGHPNIAGVSSYFDQNDTSYFVMDYIEGVSFKSYIANNGGKVSVDETLNVMIPVLRALTAVHAEGFIHRDVTPDNIYISKDGNVKLLDFGSARYSIGDKSKSLDVILKVGYAPKEQYIRRGRQGPFTDVYSCAACFYAALTGYLPPESLERLDHDELVPVSQVLPEIPEWLDKAILKGLAIQPEDRFQSAAEFLDAIENQLVVEVPAAGAPAQPVKKKANPLILGGIAAAIVVAVGLGAILGGSGGGDDNGGGGGILGAITGQDDGLPPLKKAEVPSITIQGQEYSTDLRKLNLKESSNLTDEDFAQVKHMINLTELQVPAQNQISDLSPLEGLTELRVLNLASGNWSNTPISYIKDLSPLAGLTELEDLRIVGPTIDDLSFLENCTKLTRLDMWCNFSTTDFGVFRNLTSLKDLRLSYVDYNIPFLVEDMSVFSGLTQLEVLRLDVDQMDSFDWAKDLTNLVTLELYSGNATYTEVDGLATLTKVQTMRLPMRQYMGQDKTGPYDIQGLAGLTELTSLDIPCGVKDFGPLQNLTRLQSLSISNGGNVEGAATDLSPLANLTELTSLELRISGDHVHVDASPLAGLTKLQALTLDAQNWDWQDNSPSITNFSALGELTNLRSLSLSMRHVTDISPLRSLTNLQSVTLTDGSDVVDLSPLDHVPSVNLNR
ncbi:MAG: protein kinase [Lawsonibacter sp.]|nr:protein kinase [Lawsonibacter sp.]